MNNKYFIIISLLIAILIFSILPIANYIADPSRVLHHDYKTRYPKFHPHKLFLKVDYLIDNPNKYDTLVYGSSRGGFIDLARISPNAYNMSHGFGTVTNYLHSLKSLLANKVKVENVWIGINDFVIWRDHTENLARLINKNNLIGNIQIYSHWLFRLIPESIQILKQDIALIETKEITNPQARIRRAREQEEKIKGMKRNIPASTLGYTGMYRINQAIKEIEEIKILCEKNNIHLTVFMYPIFYKTYLKYNQNKIKEFKRKLVSITDFYDFYDLGELSINQDNWFEGSHFVPSVADFMIKNIKENNFLVTKENIEMRITETQSYIKNMALLPLGDFQRYSPSIDVSNFNLIFDINNNKFRYFKNNHFIFQDTGNKMTMIVNNTDPIIILNQTKTEKKQVILTININSQKDSYIKLYMKKTKKSKYDEKHSYKVAITRGKNELRLIMSSQYINNELRVDLANNIGEYTLNTFTVHAL